MERLIKDAAKLDKSIKANDMSFGNIVKSIHAVQTEMKITGTTSKEASTTISGSISSMKASWKNLLVGFVSGNKNIDKLIDDFIKSLNTVAQNVIPKVVKTLPKLANGIFSIFDKANPMIGNFVKSLTAAAITFGSLTAAMKATKVIKSVITSFNALRIALTAATGAQISLNAAMNANVIGGIITGVSILVGIVTSLGISLSNASEKTDLLSESQRNAIEAADEAAEAYKETKDAADEMAEAGNAQLDYVEKLWKELETLADANGKVKDSDKARADFIIGELNDALGKEYSMTGNVINNYKEIKKSIAEVIEAKRAQILLEAYEESYAAAIKNVTDAENTRAIKAQELAAQEKVYEEARTKAMNARQALDEATANAKTEADFRALASEARVVQSLEIAAQTEKGILDTKRTKYNETEATVKGYYDNIDSYQRASALVLEGEVDKANDILSKYSGGFKTAASVVGETKEEQIRILKEQVAETSINLGIMEAKYEATQEKMTEAERVEAKRRIDNARQQAEDAKNEYANVGGNIVEGMTKGVKDGEWKLTGSLKTIVDSAVGAVKKALGINSPSRVFMKIGKFIDEGLKIGIKSGEDDVYKAVENLSEGVIDSFGEIPNYGIKSSSKSKSDFNDSDVSTKGSAPIVLNIYSKAMTAADLMQEAMYQIEREGWLGV